MTNLAVKIADSVRANGVKAVYGDPIDIDGVKVVPVALAYFGFGGGTSGNEETGGGGGGGLTVPVGAYYSDETGVRFRPNTIALMAAGIPLTFVLGRALARIIKALKK